MGKMLMSDYINFSIRIAEERVRNDRKYFRMMTGVFLLNLTILIYNVIALFYFQDKWTYLAIGISGTTLCWLLSFLLDFYTDLHFSKYYLARLTEVKQARELNNE